ncbi:response regulator [Pseudooceanicola sp. MF1-13]|uniref:response regulator n=1 Tax=Pseudooceanicola sp. MF1-13 TaxID=3379095 RepID=UPI0038916C51
MARIFIADDDRDYLEAFRMGLESIGHTVFQVDSGDKVIEIVENSDFDIIFLDVVMAGGGAISLVHPIRTRRPDTPVVVMTGHAELYNSAVFTQGFRLANARIKKSASLDEIKALVTNLLYAR